MIQLWHYWEIACSKTINKIFFHCYKKRLKWGDKLIRKVSPSIQWSMDKGYNDSLMPSIDRSIGSLTCHTSQERVPAPLTSCPSPQRPCCGRIGWFQVDPSWRPSRSRHLPSHAKWNGKTILDWKDITIESLWSSSLDSQHHPAIYWAKSMLWEHSSRREICDFHHGQPFWL